MLARVAPDALEEIWKTIHYLEYRWPVYVSVLTLVTDDKKRLGYYSHQRREIGLNFRERGLRSRARHRLKEVLYHEWAHAIRRQFLPSNLIKIKMDISQSLAGDVELSPENVFIATGKVNALKNESEAFAELFVWHYLPESRNYAHY